LWKALRQGWLQAIATDHCAFSRRQKNTWGGDFLRIPYGLPGVETSLSVTYTQGPASGKLPLHRWVKLHTEGPARLFGLFPQKGSLRPGADADLVIWDTSAAYPIRSSKLQSVCDWSPFEGMRKSGQARQVFLRGVEIARQGRYLETGIKGRFIAR
jgi:dihydropyrimidinase